MTSTRSQGLAGDITWAYKSVSCAHDVAISRETKRSPPKKHIGFCLGKLRGLRGTLFVTADETSAVAGSDVARRS